MQGAMLLGADRTSTMTGSISGIRLPKGLKQAEKLPEPLFTPSTKADIGEHDQNISFNKVVNILGLEPQNGYERKRWKSTDSGRLGLRNEESSLLTPNLNLE